MTTKRHFTMRMNSELYERMQQYADVMQKNATAIVEDSLKQSLPVDFNNVSCKIRVIEQGNVDNTLRCELFVPHWNKIEFWEIGCKKKDNENAVLVLQKKALDWLKDRILVDDVCEGVKFEINL